MKVAIVYHAVDLDGEGSAAIALRALRAEGHEVTLVPWNYGWPLDRAVLAGQARIYWLDICPVSDTADWLLELGVEMVLADHHATNVQRLEDDRLLGGFQEWKLNCTGGAPSAIELTWSLFTDEPAPEWVRLLSEYDSNPDELREGQHWDDDVLPFQMGLRTWPTDPESSIWDKLAARPELVSEIKSAGRAQIRARDIAARKFGPTAFYAVGFRGLRALATNGSPVEGAKYHPEHGEAEIVLSYRYDPLDDTGKPWKCTVWPGPKAAADFHAGEWAKAGFGGGGHKGCAGFSLQLPPAKD